ncbi:unnamed protein product [Trichobilharzia szidati]|nr:unnamed protein product [Trichobilharzia szidati]
MKPVCDHGDYCVQISFSPITGLDEDIKKFTDDFASRGSFRFVDFADLWNKHKVIHLIHGRQNQHGLYDIIGCIFHRLVDLFQPNSSKSKFVQICALYLMYAFHGKQPIRNHVRIRVCPVSWSWIVDTAIEARDEGQLDVYYVFRKLCAANAFLFCATRQVLYPGAPLFDSPPVKDESEKNIKSPSGNISDELQLMFGNRRDLRTISLPVVKDIQSPSSGINQAVQCLNLSLSRYVESKRLLMENLRATGGGNDVHSLESEDGLENEETEFLPGLNLVTFPESLNRIEMLASELEESTKQTSLKYRYMSRTNKSNPSSEQSPSSNTQIIDKENNLNIPPCPATVVASGIVENKIKRCKNSKSVCKNQLSNSQKSPRQSSSKENLIHDSAKEKEVEKDEEEPLDWGERIRLLKRASTWAEELAEQAKGVHKDGCHRNRRRPTKPKVITSSIRRNLRQKSLN